MSLLYKLKSKIPKTGKSKYDWEYLSEDKIKEISPIGSIIMTNGDIHKPILPPKEPGKGKGKRKNTNKEIKLVFMLFALFFG